MIKKINEIFGYTFFALGAAKILLVIFILLKVGTSLATIFRGGYVNAEYFSTLTTILGFLELSLLIGAIVMIIVNIKKQPEVIVGYIWGLGAILLEFVLPSSIMFFALFAQCSMFMKAGSKIRQKNAIYTTIQKTSRKMIKNTEWFYSNEKNNINQEKKKSKKQLEIEDWKELDEKSQIDERVYNQEVNGIMELIKENLLIIVLAVLIVIFIVSVMLLVTKNNDTPNIETARPKEIHRTYENNESNFNNTNNEETSIVIQEKDTRLEQIASIFNSNNSVEEMRLKGYIMNASASKDEITVRSSGDGLFFKIKFVLNNNILSTQIIYNQEDSRFSVIEMLLAIILVDSVGQMKGFPERTLIDILGHEDALNYTIENQGVEIKQLDNNKGAEIKVDLNSDFSFVNM